MSQVLLQELNVYQYSIEHHIARENIKLDKNLKEMGEINFQSSYLLIG